MLRFQAALKNYLNRQIDKLKLELRELVRTVPSSLPAGVFPHTPDPASLSAAGGVRQANPSPAAGAGGGSLWGPTAAGPPADAAREKPGLPLDHRVRTAAEGAGAAGRALALHQDLRGRRQGAQNT